MLMFDDISPRWRQDAKRSTRPLTILSPYITGDVALGLLKGKVGSQNLTRGSQLNNELSVHLKCELARLQAMALVEPRLPLHTSIPKAYK